MVTRLAKTANGRMVLHTVVLVNALIHLKTPNFKFYCAALERFLNGNG